LDKEFLDLSKESMIPFNFFLFFFYKKKKKKKKKKKNISIIRWFEHVDDHTRQIFFSTNENGIIDPTKDPKFSNVVYDYKFLSFFFSSFFLFNIFSFSSSLKIQKDSKIK